MTRHFKRYEGLKNDKYGFPWKQFTYMCFKILVVNMQRMVHSFADCLMVLSGDKSDQSSFHWSTAKANHCR